MASMNDLLFTTWAESGVHLMAWGIPNINIFEPHFLSNLIGLLQCLDRSRWEMGQFILGEESVEMDGGIFSQIGFYPNAHLPDVFGVVVQCWNHEIDDFEVSSIRFDGSEGVEDRLQL